MADELTVSISVDATSPHFTEENVRLVNRTIDVAAGNYKYIRLEIDVGTSSGMRILSSSYAGPGDYEPGGYLIVHHVGNPDGSDDMKPAYIYANTGDVETVKIKAGETFLFRTSSVMTSGEPRARYISSDPESNFPVLEFWYFEA